MADLAQDVARTNRRRDSAVPSIADHAFLSDSHCVALVTLQGTVDWCCMPRLDAGSCFGALLDPDRGGFCTVRPSRERANAFRRYVADTLVLETTFRMPGGEARLLDFFAVRAPDGAPRSSRLVRIVEGIRGHTAFLVEISPRFDYGGVRPWIRQHGVHRYSAIGGNDGLVISSDIDLSRRGRHDLAGEFEIRAGQRMRLALEYRSPEDIDAPKLEAPGDDEIDDDLERTLEHWRRWSAQGDVGDPYSVGARMSALVLKGLSYRPTGAIAAAATTSLPEAIGGARNWDYRYSWIRDSCMAVRALYELGCEEEADGFRRFVQRSAAGSIDDLQIAYGVGGERRIKELTLDGLAGYRDSAPVRIGNLAGEQRQLDVFGWLAELTWQWHRRGHSPDDDYWRFLVELVDGAATAWEQPDRGIWEVRGEPEHFVHSKAMCWVAVDRGIQLAEECMRRAPLRRWRSARRQIREAIERHGLDHRRGIFVRAFGSKDLDASLLLLPIFGFVAHDDPRMVATVDAVMDELESGGLIRRHRVADGVRGREGAFVPASFWLAECLANQGRIKEARETFERGLSTANELGLFAEEFDPVRREMLGNFPQALTHLSHIAAAIALVEAAEQYEGVAEVSDAAEGGNTEALPASQRGDVEA